MIRTIDGIVPNAPNPWAVDSLGRDECAPVLASTVRTRIDDLISRLQFLRESVGETDVRVQQITNLLNDLKSEWRNKS